MTTLCSNNDNDTSEDFSGSTMQETSSENRIYFINDTNFKHLQRLQQEIYAQTEMKPSIRKLVNDLITNDNLNTLKTKLLKEINI